MVQRARKTQVCGVCNRHLASKVAMDEHIKEFHGDQSQGGWPPAMLTRAKDQQEFKPCLGQTPWGKELR